MKKITLLFSLIFGANFSLWSQNKNEWIDLLASKNISYWRAYNGTTLPKQWEFKNGALICAGKTDDKSDLSGDIVFADHEFGEFEMVLEWKIKKGSNSGIFYHIVENEKYQAPYYTAPEYQIIDQIGYPQKLELWQSIGADYAMYEPDYKGALKNIGEWNQTKIIFKKNKVEYWLNNKKTVSFVPWSKDWKTRKANGKWKTFDDYGKFENGLIGLQNHGDPIEFKNFKIRKL